MKTKLYLLLLLGLAAACNRHSKKPRLYLHNPLVIMDTVHMDTTYTIWFVLLNKGEAPLEIDTIAPTCECTLPLLPEKTLNPRDSMPMRVEFRPQDTGYFAKTLIIRSNCDTTFAELHFQGYCRRKRR